MLCAVAIAGLSGLVPKRMVWTLVRTAHLKTPAPSRGSAAGEQHQVSPGERERGIISCSMQLESEPNGKQISLGKWYRQLFWEVTVYLYNNGHLFHHTGVGISRHAQRLMDLWSFRQLEDQQQLHTEDRVFPGGHPGK